MMVRRRHRQKTKVDGFSLLEALIAMALMGLILAALRTVTAQWLPNWNHGMRRLQGHEQLAIGLERIAADLAAAEFIAGSRQTRQPLFEGGSHSVTFVRLGIGPTAGPELDIVRIAEADNDAKELVVVRTRTPFAPLNADIKRDPLNFTDPVVLLRAPYRLSFSYAGTDRIWRDAWKGQPDLPAAIKLTVRDANSQQAIFVSTAVSVHANIPVECIAAKSMAECVAVQSQPPDAKPRS